MDFISSKNIFLLTRDTLKLLDKEVMKHGSRTGYIYYMMLKERGSYEKFELAEYVLLATLHDVGIYRTNVLDDNISREVKNVMPHSIYGYLFLKYLSPMDVKSKIVLYHHLDYSKLKDIDFEYKEEVALLSYADRIDSYMTILGENFNLSMLEKRVGEKFSEEAIELFRSANEKYNVLEKIKTEEYEQELDELLDFIMFTNEEKKRYMEMLMFCLGFRSENKVVDSVTSIYICEALAKYLYMDESEVEKLYYGALIHDLGMLAIPSEIIDSERKLTTEELALMRTHVDISERILGNRLDNDVLAICTSHHERLDGSGYPKGISEGDMNLSQKILQVADTVTAMVNERSYKKAATKEEVLAVLKKEVGFKRFSKQVVEPMVTYYDEIMEKVKAESNQILSVNKKMEAQFQSACKKYETIKA